MDKLADSALLKLYLNIQDSITPDTPEHEGSVSVKTPLVSLKSSVIAELFPDDGQANNTLLYGNIRVNKKVHDCWLADLKKRRYMVKLPKLTEADIKLWQPVDKSWKQIDPYLDLDDIGDIDNTTANQKFKTVVSHLKSNHTLQSRKPKEPFGSA